MIILLLREKSNIYVLKGSPHRRCQVYWFYPLLQCQIILILEMSCDSVSKNVHSWFNCSSKVSKTTLKEKSPNSKIQLLTSQFSSTTKIIKGGCKHQISDCQLWISIKFWSSIFEKPKNRMHNVNSFPPTLILL